MTKHSYLPFKSTEQDDSITQWSPEAGASGSCFDLIIGFDAEWVRANRCDDSLPATDNILISWQIAAFDASGERSVRFIRYAEGTSRRNRVALKTLLDGAVKEAFKAGLLDNALYEGKNGKRLNIAVVGHFLRADLTTLRDYPDFKKRVDSVRKTFATTTRPTTMNIYGLETSITFADTMLLAPSGSSLAMLGETIGIPKIELPEGAIAKMDFLLKENPRLFEQYAMNDAIIAAKYFIIIWKHIRDQLGVEKHAATLSNVGQSVIIHLLDDLGIEPERFFGYERIKGKRHILTCISTAISFASNCYHGGRNEAFRVGPTPKGIPLYDLDLKGAYTTALALVRIPHWEGVRMCHNLDELAVVDDAMTFARVKFEFPENTRFPSLPVREGDRGLIYPLNGTSWCCGPELVVAMRQGAKLTVEEGWRVDWENDSIRPMEYFAKMIAEQRASAKKHGNKLLDLLFKEIGNSAYGRISQGVANQRTVKDHGVSGGKRRGFSARTGMMEDIGASRITCPFVGAYIVSVVRAAVSEALSSMPEDAVVCSVTTDGILSSVSIEDLDVSGPIAGAFSKSRTAIAGKSEIWEEKHRIGRALVVKTRGCLTLEPFDPSERERNPPILARCGHKFSADMKMQVKDFGENERLWRENEYWLEVYRTRTYETKCFRKSLTTLRKQYDHDADIVEEVSLQRVNFDFDMKREIVEPTDCDGLLCADTRPWRNQADFETARGNERRNEGLEGWKKSRRRVLKNSEDFFNLHEWMEGRDRQKIQGASPHSKRPKLVDSFLRAIANRELGEKWQYVRIVEFMSKTEFPVTIDIVKKSKMRKRIEPLKELTDTDKTFVEYVCREAPSLSMDIFVAAGSPAAQALKELIMHSDGSHANSK
jgi:hypothetical protein